MNKEEIQKRWGRFRWVFWLVILAPFIASFLFFLIAPGFIVTVSEDALFNGLTVLGCLVILMYLWLLVHSIRLAIFISGRKITGVFVFLLNILLLVPWSIRVHSPFPC